MAKVNLRTATASGKLEWKGTMVGYHKKVGGQILRRLAEEYLRPNTEKWLKSKFAISFFTSLWKLLPAEVKTMWEAWASRQGSAHEMEKNEVVTYKYCPISKYPPRPRVAGGFAEMVGHCCQSAAYGFDGFRYKEPGIKIPSPPPGVRIIGYQPTTGEVEVELQTRNIFQPAKCDQARILIWVNLHTGGKYLARQHLLTALDCPLAATTIRHKFGAIQSQTKYLDYAKEIVLAKLRYFYLDIGAQIAATYGAERTCSVSAGSWLHTIFLNDPRLIEIADLIKAGEFRDVGKITFNADFQKTLRHHRRISPQPSQDKLLNMAFTVLSDNALAKFTQKFVTVRSDKR